MELALQLSGKGQDKLFGTLNCVIKASSSQSSHIRFATICLISQCNQAFCFYAMLNIR